MNVVIAGTRKLASHSGFIKEKIAEELAKLGGPAAVTVVSGMAKGPDMFAVEIAVRDKYSTLEYAPRPERGVAGLFERNEAMSVAADRLVAFWDGRSGGTKHMIGCMLKAAKPCTIYTYVAATDNWDVRRSLWTE